MVKNKNLQNLKRVENQTGSIFKTETKHAEKLNICRSETNNRV